MLTKVLRKTEIELPVSQKTAPPFNRATEFVNVELVMGVLVLASIYTAPPFAPELVSEKTLSLIVVFGALCTLTAPPSEIDLVLVNRQFEIAVFDA